jgi:hypothetical protein
MFAQPPKYGYANRVKKIYQKGSDVKSATKSADLSRRVVAAIESYKGTLRSFSRESDIPYGSLFAYASGEKKPGLDALAAIVKVSGVSPGWLFTGEGEMHQHPETTRTLHIDGKLLAGIERAVERALSGPEFLDLNEQLHADVEQQLAQHFGAEYNKLSRDDRVYYTVTLYKHLYWMGLDRIDQKHVADVDGLIRLLKLAKSRPMPGHLKRKKKQR